MRSLLVIGFPILSGCGCGVGYGGAIPWGPGSAAGMELRTETPTG